MTMEVRTMLEMLTAFTVYTFSVFLAPYFVFYRYLKEKTLAEKFILCVLIGNFYIINMVFLMFLLHIPSRPMLYVFIIVPALFAWRQINHPGIKRFFSLLYTAISRLFLGEAKIRTIWTILSHQPKKMLARTIRSIFSHAIHHFLEWVMLLGLLSFDVWYYGYHAVTRYDYGAPDLSVHHYWVNQLDKGTIFCNGVYPFGFHNMIYFLHAFFGIEIVSIMRVFGVIQTLYIYLMLYVLLRLICRSKYLPFLGLFVYTLPNLFNVVATFRFQSALPQEFGIIFLYPCAYFLIQYFQRKKDEMQAEREWAKEKKLYAWMDQYHILPSTRSLVFFAMSFCLTLSAHFYITIAAIFLCLAVAIAYFPVVLHPRLFWSIALAGILSVVTAIAPLGVAMMQGTGMEGSLYWALDILNAGRTSSASSEASSDSTDSTSDVITDSSSGFSATTSDGMLSGGGNTPAEDTSLTDKILEKLQNIPVLARNYAAKIKNKYLELDERLRTYLCNVCIGFPLSSAVVWCMEGLAAFSVLAILIRRKYYYRNLLFITIYVLFMALMCCAANFNLPGIMELSRASIFMAYAVPLLAAAAADAIYVILFRPIRYHRITEILPIGLTAMLIYLTVTNDYVRPLSMTYITESSGEVHCNYEIMDNYPDKSWTVVTTTNSLQVLQSKGWHMEMCTFLDEMEDYTPSSRVTIPSKYVFFYIEKEPVLFGYAGSVSEPLGTSGYVSREAAAQDAVFEGGQVYRADNRYILESKFFYWAKAFEEKFPQEFRVYYEDDSFICYRIIQNVYNLYNFAIDYGYNS